MFSLSIIIPTYSRACLVEKTLGSLMHQTRTDFQIILVDHGSTDTTEDVYLKYKDIFAALLCYRLSQQNMTIAFVEDGWCAEIPHHREEIKERIESNQRNMLTCYFKQLTLALESLNLTRMLLRLAVDVYYARTGAPRGKVIASISQPTRQLSLTHSIRQAEEIFFYLAALGQSERNPLISPVSHCSNCFSRRYNAPPNMLFF